LNRGIKVAKTALIARMDSDDISYPERLQKQYDFILSNPDGALYSCWVRVVGQQGQFIRQDIFPSDYYFYNLTFICWIYHPTIIFRKKAVEEVGMYTVPYAEDFELFWQLSRKYKIYNLPEVLLDYRVTDQSLHKVLKKKEYQEAQYKQLLRNLRFYAGNSYSIPQDYLDCLQHNFQPLLTTQSIGKIAACIHELDFLTQRILAKENINRDENSIKAAAFFKRRFIIDFFSTHLKGLKGIILLLRLKETELLKWLIKNKIKKALFLKTRPSV
ncbi:MAG: glycosyltransferase, partial [Ferruginibacter sp.]|nr:glycosyltransferase [Ferruginibacter sp.]